MFKSIVRKLIKVIPFVLLASLFPTVVGAIVYTMAITVVNTTANNYTMLPIIVGTSSTISNNNTWLAQNHYISTSGLDTRIYSGNDTCPHMLSEDRTLFADNISASETKTYEYRTGQTPLSDYYILTGYDGYVTVADNSTLELDRHFDISISGYFDMSAGANKNCLYKDNATAWYVSAVNTLSCNFTDSDASDNFTLTSAMNTGEHIVRIYANGMTAYLMIDGIQMDTQALDEHSSASLGVVANSVTEHHLQRHGFYAEGRYWAFYQNLDSNIAYKTSTDGAAWGAETEITTDNATQYQYHFDICYNNGYMYYVRKDGTALGFRRGEPQSDGSIVWSAVEQTPNIGAEQVYSSVSIAVNTSDMSQIAFVKRSGANYRVSIVKNDNTDGTWSTTAGYPYEPYGAQSGKCGITAIPNSDAMYLVFSPMPAGTVNSILGMYYNGTNWAGSTTTFASTNQEPRSLNADIDGNVYVTWAARPAYCRIRDSSGALGTAFEVCNGANQYAITSYDSIDESMYFFYSKNNSGLYFKHYINGTLGSEHEITNGTFPFRSSCYLQSYEDHIGVVGVVTGGTVYHGILEFPWEWNDTANDWIWMQNNSMSYADNMTVSVQGSDVLWYEPVSILARINDATATLPDRQGAREDGVITWGSNIAGVTATIGGIVAPPVPGGSGASSLDTDSIDILPTVNPNLNVNATEPDNAFTPLFEMWADLWDVPHVTGWIILAMILVIGSFALTYATFHHLGAALCVASIFLGIFSLPTIAVLPTSGLVIGIVGLICGVVVEAKA